MAAFGKAPGCAAAGSPQGGSGASRSRAGPRRGGNEIARRRCANQFDGHRDPFAYSPMLSSMHALQETCQMAVAAPNHDFSSLSRGIWPAAGLIFTRFVARRCAILCKRRKATPVLKSAPRVHAQVSKIDPGPRPVATQGGAVTTSCCAWALPGYGLPASRRTMANNHQCAGGFCAGGSKALKYN